MKSLYNTIIGYANPEDLSDEMIAAVTSDFDRLFELSWKTLKEYMLNELMILNARTVSPKEILKLSFSQNLIDDENIWLQILKDRNDDTHHYNNTAALLYMSRINEKYLPIIYKLVTKLNTIIPAENLPDSKIPTDFIPHWKASGLSMEEYITKLRTENNLSINEDVFLKWQEIKK